MGDYTYGRENGLWGEDGIPYDIADQLDSEFDDEESNFNFEHEDDSLADLTIKKTYSKADFPGMRDSGQVLTTENYTIAEYENKGFRLKSVALEIEEKIENHFILYDYKGGIQSDNSKVIKVLKELYGSDMNVEHDQLMILDTLLSIKPSEFQTKHPNSNDEFRKSMNSPQRKVSINFWHMQLHQSDKEWVKEKQLLQEYSFIGIDENAPPQYVNNFLRINIGDVVAIRRGDEPIALVEVTGNSEEIDNNKSKDLHLDRFKYRRKVRVLQYASYESDDMPNFPSIPGAITLAKNRNTETYKYIENWLKHIPKSLFNPVNIPNEIKISSASPSFGVESISKTLASIITRTPDKNGMMVGIFGKWGRGKTYLFDKIWDSINTNDDKYYRVNFSAWKYQETKESWAYLYESMMNQYLSNPSGGNWFSTLYSKYEKLYRLNINKHTAIPIISFSIMIIVSIWWSFLGGSFQALNFIISSIGIIVAIKILVLFLTKKNKASGLLKKYTDKPSYIDYLGMQAEIEAEIELLLKTWVPGDNKKILLFVDDIDRCETSKIVKLIDGLRIILDNPEIHKRLVIITAIDEKILKESIEQKYPNIIKEDKKDLFQEYLEKIFIIGIKLNDLNQSEVAEYLSKLIPKREKENQEIKKTSKSNPPPANPNRSNEKTNKHDAPIREQDLNPKTDAILSTSKSPSIADNTFELSEEEEAALIDSITRLESPTPRKIKIFYYKYLILKQIFHVRLLSKDLVKTWDVESDEKLIIDILIYVSNNKSTKGFDKENVSQDVMSELKYSANMLSIL